MRQVDPRIGLQHIMRPKNRTRTRELPNGRMNVLPIELIEKVGLATLPLSMAFTTWYENILKKYNYNKVFARHYNVYQIRIVKYCFDGFTCIICFVSGEISPEEAFKDTEK